MALPFANKVITITGGARGMGLATARYLAQRGSTVCLADVRKPELEQARKTLEHDFPKVKVQADVVDVRHPDQVNSWIKSVKTNHGKLDGCLNGAGERLNQLCKSEVNSIYWQASLGRLANS